MLSIQRLLPAFISLLACTATLNTSAQESPQVVLKGTVTSAQNHSFIDLPFDVPQGVHRLTVDIHYTDREKETVLNTEIADPFRFRGTSGSNKNHFTIGESDATPSFLPGTIPAGKWKLTFTVSNIRQNMVSSYEADIFFGREPHIDVMIERLARHRLLMVTGKRLAAQIPGKGTAGDIFMQVQFPLHSGRILGLGGRILISAVGVAVAVLSITGLLIWVKKLNGRRRSARNANLARNANGVGDAAAR